MPEPRAIRVRRLRRVGLAVVAASVLMLPLPFVGSAALAQEQGEKKNALAGFDPNDPTKVMEQVNRIFPKEADEDTGPLSGPLSILLLLTVLTIAPALLVLTTSFTRIVIVLALLRQAIGTQSLPPSQVIVGLAMFMTFLVMAPTMQRINNEALVPMQDGEITQQQAWPRAKQPVRDFMFDQIDYAENWDDVYMMLEYQGVNTEEPERLTRADVDMVALVPAFVLSELKVAFLMGFRLYLPFLIIDMVISSVLISMGMLMLPPVLISLPFKLLLFVLADGWRLVAGNLLNSFSIPESMALVNTINLSGMT